MPTAESYIPTVDTRRRHRHKPHRNPPMPTGPGPSRDNAPAERKYHRSNERKRLRREARRNQRQQTRQRNARRLSRVASGAAYQPPTVQQASRMLSTLAPKTQERLGPQLFDRYSVTEQNIPQNLYRFAPHERKVSDRLRAKGIEGTRFPNEGWGGVALDLASLLPVGRGIGLGIDALRAARAGGEAASLAGDAANASRLAAAAGKVASKVPHPYEAARGAIGRGAGSLAGKAAVRVGETGVGKAAGKLVASAAEKPSVAFGAKAVATTGKVAAKPVSLAVKRPFTTPILAQAPVALAGGPGLQNAFSGQGVFAQGSNALAGLVPGGAGNVASNIVRDALQLPSSALPSVYLPLAGIVEAAQGDPTRLDALWNSYKETGLFPAIASGDPSKVLEAIKNHPLFTAAEASGAYALAGRGLRVGALAAGAKDAASTARDPLIAYGTDNPIAVPRSYSKNLITKGVQRVREERARAEGRDPNRANKKQAEIILTGKHGIVPALEGHRNYPIGTVHRFMHEHIHGVQRVNREEVQRAFLDKAAPKTAKFKRRAFIQGADVVSEVAQGSVRSPQTWHEDLLSRLDQLKAAEPTLGKSEVKNNRDLQAAIEKALTITDPKAIQAVFNLAHDYVAQVKERSGPIQDQGLLDPQAAEARTMLPYALRFMGGRRGRSNETEAQIAELKAAGKDAAAARLALTSRKELIDAKGDRLTPERIRADMQKNGVEAGYLTHQQGISGNASYYRASIRRPRLNPKSASGESFNRGTYESGIHALTAQLSHIQTVHDAVKLYDNFHQRHSIGISPDQPFLESTRGEAERVAAEINADPALQKAAGLPEGMEIVAVRIDAPYASKAERDALDKSASPQNTGALEPVTNDPQAFSQRLYDAARGAYQGPPTQRGKFAFEPKAVRDAFLEQQKPSGAGMRALQQYNQSFKAVVLPTSTKWALGNMFELQMRMLLNGVVPFPFHFIDPRYHLGRRLLEEQKIDPQAAAKFRSSTTGTFFTGEEQARMRRDANEISDSLGVLRSKPVVGNLMRLYDKYSGFIFHLNEAMERTGTTTIIGKEALRQQREMGKSWTKAVTLQRDAIHDLARNSLGTHSQLAFAHAVEDVFGRWKANSPAVRKGWLQIAPFWMWTRAAFRFIGLTLPVKHPIKLAILAAATEMTQKEREQMGLDALSDRPVPQELQGGLPTTDVVGDTHGLIPTQYYTSFGMAAGFPKDIATTILPQFASAWQALQGSDWKGDKLRNPDGTYMSGAQTVPIAAYSLLEGVFPGLAIARRLQEGGGTSAPGSTVLTPQTVQSSYAPDPSFLGALKKIVFPTTLPAGLVDSLRNKAHSQEITVPLSGSSSSSGNLFDGTSSTNLFDGGSSTNLFDR